MHLNTDMTVNRITDEIWEIPLSEKPGMLVPARIYATEGILQAMDSGVFDQVTNVACLPGIRRYALCMPDGHWGYGFPIGGVAAFDVQDGVISPGGVGYDINCGMRLIRTDLTLADVQPHLERLMTELFRRVPAGVGANGFDPVTAAALGITGHEQIAVTVHCGSRGFGHQVASDYLKVFEKAMRRYGITVKDQQLACAPFRPPEGQDYFSAMNCAANTAFAN